MIERLWTHHALALSFGVYLLVMATVLGGLLFLDASSELLVLAYLLILSAGSYGVSRVGTRHLS